MDGPHCLFSIKNFTQKCNKESPCIVCSFTWHLNFQSPKIKTFSLFKLQLFKKVNEGNLLINQFSPIFLDFGELGGKLNILWFFHALSKRWWPSPPPPPYGRLANGPAVGGHQEIPVGHLDNDYKRENIDARIDQQYTSYP